MDTTALSGISTAAAQAAHVSPPKPVSPVKAPERSSSANGQDSAFAKDARGASKDGEATTSASPEKEVDEKQIQYVEETLAGVVGESFDSDTSLQVVRDDETGKIIFKIVSKSTGEVIRQVPTEEMVALARSLITDQGVLVNKEA